MEAKARTHFQEAGGTPMQCRALMQAMSQQLLTESKVLRNNMSCVMHLHMKEETQQRLVFNTEPTQPTRVAHIDSKLGNDAPFACAKKRLLQKEMFAVLLS